MTGSIFNIQKFCLHDGPGIRTTVFFKGCNLACRWCANPESQAVAPQLTLDPGKCTACGRCGTVCPQGARHLEKDRLYVDGEKCTFCGLCLRECPNQAIGREGRCVTAEQVLEEVLKDKVFYEHSGGGVTFSGGEVLLQAPFAAELARALHEHGIHVAIETAGAVEKALFAALLNEADYVLMDLKHHDPAAHLAGTGADNRQVLENLAVLSRSGKPFLVRIPVIPGFNDSLEDGAAFAGVLKKLDISRVQLLPFHQMGRHKYALLGRQYDYDGVPQLREEDLAAYGREFTCRGITVAE